jgi:hypothetical protein
MRYHHGNRATAHALAYNLSIAETAGNFMATQLKEEWPVAKTFMHSHGKS